MSFVNFNNPVSSAAMQWAAGATDLTRQTVRDFFVAVSKTYLGMWDQKDTDPQGPLDRIAALDTGAAAAFQAHAASVQYLLSVLPLFDGTADMIAQAQTWTLPAGWTITFNPDGSANVTPPAPAPAPT